MDKKKLIVVLTAIIVLLAAVSGSISYYESHVDHEARLAALAGNTSLAESLVINHDRPRHLLTIELVTLLKQQRAATFVALSQWAAKRGTMPRHAPLDTYVARHGFFPALIHSHVSATSLLDAAKKDGIRDLYLRASVGLYELARHQMLQSVKLFSGPAIYRTSWSRERALLSICALSNERATDAHPILELYAHIGGLLHYYETMEANITSQIHHDQKIAHRLKRKLRDNDNLHFHIYRFIPNGGTTVDQLFLARRHFPFYHGKRCRAFIIAMSPHEYRQFGRLEANVTEELSARIDNTGAFKITTQICRFGNCTDNDTLYGGYLISGIHAAVGTSAITQKIRDAEASVAQLREAAATVKHFDCMYGPGADDSGASVCPVDETQSITGTLAISQYHDEKSLVRRILGAKPTEAGVGSPLVDLTAPAALQNSWIEAPAAPNPASGQTPIATATKTVPLRVTYQFPAPGYYKALSNGPDPAHASCETPPVTRRTWPGLSFDSVPGKNSHGKQHWYQYLEVGDHYFPIDIKGAYEGESIISACTTYIPNTYFTNFVLLTAPDETKVAVVEVETAGASGSGLSANVYRIGKTGVRQVMSIGVANGSIQFKRGLMTLVGTVTPPGAAMADARQAKLRFGWDPKEHRLMPLGPLDTTSREFYRSLGAPAENVPLTGLGGIPHH